MLHISCGRTNNPLFIRNRDRGPKTRQSRVINCASNMIEKVPTRDFARDVTEMVHNGTALATS